MADAGRATKDKTAPRKTSERARTSAAGRAKTSGGRTARTKTSGARTTGAATATAERPSARARTTNGNRVDVPVPVLTPHMKVVHVPAPGMSYVGDAGRLIAGYLPPPERLAFYGGLGVAAVLGAIDWPVAAAIGIGTMIARRAGRGMGAMSGAGRQQTSGSRT